MVHDLLIERGRPPLDGDVPLAPGEDDPIGRLQARRDRGLLLLRKLQVRREPRQGDLDTQPDVKQVMDGLHVMPGLVVASVHQRGMTAIDPDRLRVAGVDSGDIGIVTPYIRKTRGHARNVSAWMGAMQVPNRRREHHDIARATAIRQQHFPGGLFGIHDPHPLL
jgi:hypothetical protein